MSFEESIQLGTLLVTILGLAGLYVQIRGAARQQAEDHARQKRQATIDTYAASMELRNSIWEALPNDRDLEAVRAFCPSPDAIDDPAFLLVVAHLNYFETLSTGVRFGVYDAEVLNGLVGDRLRGAWNAYGPFVDARRELLGSKLIWENLEWLATSEAFRARVDSSAS